MDDFEVEGVLSILNLIINWKYLFGTVSIWSDASSEKTEAAGSAKVIIRSDCQENIFSKNVQIKEQRVSEKMTKPFVHV